MQGKSPKRERGWSPVSIPMSHLFRTPNYKKWPLVVVLIIFFCAPLQQPNHDNPPPTLRSVFPRLRSSNISDHTYIITQRPICMHRHLAGLSFSWLGTKTRLVHMYVVAFIFHRYYIDLNVASFFSFTNITFVCNDVAVVILLEPTPWFDFYMRRPKIIIIFATVVILGRQLQKPYLNPPQLIIGR